MEKKRINVTDRRLDNFPYTLESLKIECDNFIKSLNEFETYEFLYEIDNIYYYDFTEFVIRVYRYETDDELNIRIENARKAKEKSDLRKLSKAEQKEKIDYKKFLELKEKFEK